MSDKILNIFFNNYDNLYLSVPEILFSRTDAFKSANLNYQSMFDTYWQINNLNEISLLLNASTDKNRNPEEREIYSRHLGNKISILEKKITGQNLIWFLGPIARDAIPELASVIWRSRALAGYDVRVAMLVQRQDFALKHWGRLAWKNFTYDAIAAIFLNENNFGYYNNTFSAFAKYFGAQNCSVIEFDSSAPPQQAFAALMKDVADFLHLPAAFFKDTDLYPWPNTFAGLDFSYAAKNFPFTLGGKIKDNRKDFYKMLVAVEKAEGFEALSTLPPRAQSQRLLAAFSAQNEELGQRIEQKLFKNLPQPDNFPEMPAQLPVITDSQARPFIAAMPEDLRLGMLRYFRDMAAPLTQEQLNLTKALEHYRPASTLFSGFTFPRPEPLLSVLTMTRNHKRYITDCMESVAAQKTDFPIEHIIVDDCSDDGTQDIVDNFAATHPHVRPIYLPSRSGGGYNIRTLFNACKSEFAALCDGDDYFTEPTKLQKQVDFIRQNEGCTVCFHPVIAKYEDNSQAPFIYPQAHLLPRGIRSKYYLSDLLQVNFIQTNSVIYRWRFRSGLPDWFRSDICPSDWYWHILHAETGWIGFIPEIMSIYRRHPASYYNKAFIDTLEHHKQHGMAELKTYQAINDHLKGRSFKHLAPLANGVFFDFLKLQEQDESSTLLDDACEKFPQFGLYFLKSVKFVQHKKATK